MAFVMHGPDDVDYDNKIIYKKVVCPERLVYSSHGGGEEDEQFQVTVTFAEQVNKTELTKRVLFMSAAELDMVVKEYGAIEVAKYTHDRLEELLTKMSA
jgi:uncharacterized protein YndB with AHSA1/START domain